MAISETITSGWRDI